MPDPQEKKTNSLAVFDFGFCWIRFDLAVDLGFKMGLQTSDPKARSRKVCPYHQLRQSKLAIPSRVPRYRNQASEYPERIGLRNFFRFD